MAYEQKDGDISLFRNKTKKDKQPDMVGSAVIDGVKYKVSCWKKGEGESSFLAGQIKIDDYKPKPKEDDINPPPDEHSDLPF